MGSILNIVIQFFLILVLIIIIVLLIRYRKSLKKEKRVTAFAIDSLNERNLSLFDRINLKYNVVVTSISNVLKKSSLFKAYSKCYERYVEYSDDIKKEAMNFISRKLLAGSFVVIIVIISDVLRLKNISLIQIFIAFIFGFFILDVFWEIERRKRNKEIEEDFLKAITIMSNAFQSGRSIMQAIELVSLELQGPIAMEFKKMYIDFTYGLELEEVFLRFVRRVDLEDAKYMTSSLIILNKTGGNIVKIFSSIEKNFFERKKLRDELKSTIALSSIVFKILIAVPIVVFIMIYLLNPKYFVPLVTSFSGVLILSLVLMIYFIYIVVVRKIVKKGECS